MHIVRGHRLYFPKNIAFLSQKIIFALANNADPDEIPHYWAFHLGINCLSKHLFRGLGASGLERVDKTIMSVIVRKSH